jgi:hypothetical protein
MIADDEQYRDCSKPVDVWPVAYRPMLYMMRNDPPHLAQSLPTLHPEYNRRDSPELSSTANPSFVATNFTLRSRSLAGMSLFNATCCSFSTMVAMLLPYQPMEGAPAVR